jgi:CPA2 family monovalent cation:H+ antiporter-2
MGIDVREVAASPLWIPLSVVGLFAIKAAVLSVIFRAGGFSWGRAVEGGLMLGQGGEFTFIVVGYAIATKLLEPAVGQFIMLVVGLSMFATPFAAKAGRMFGDWWDRRYRAQADSLAEAAREPVDEPVIIAGFGRVGQLVAQLLMAQGIRYVAIENDPHLVAKLHPRGIPVFFGDAARVELLRKVQAGSARAIVLTMDHPLSALHAVKAIRREYPHVPLLARSRDAKHAQALKQAGATLVIPETLESGLQLSAFVLQTLGIPDGTVARVIQSERERHIAALQEETKA